MGEVLGPYGNGAKWRLVIKEGTQRKSLVFETEQEALAVRAQLSGEFLDRASRTIGEVLGEHLESKRKAGRSIPRARLGSQAPCLAKQTLIA